MNFLARNVLVLGLGRTGRSVAQFIASHGGGVRVTDGSENLARFEEFESSHDSIELCHADNPDVLLDQIEIVVPSPGIPANHPVLLRAVERGLQVVSEIECAYRSMDCPIVAVTGTNGKSTTTKLIGDMFERAGHEIFIGGNYGTPLIEAADKDYDVAIAEISSFQLEWVQHFRPQIGIFLNLSEDHLDRHGDMLHYGATKRRLFLKQGQSDWVVFNREDPVVCGLVTELKGIKCSFGWNKLPASFESAAWSDAAQLYMLHRGETKCYQVASVSLRGRHNQENIMAAVCAGTLWGIQADIIQTTLREFVGLPHRLETVRRRSGVTYVNDSKATNVDAVISSLRSFTGPVILLAGGAEKGGRYERLENSTRDKVRKLILFGEARDSLNASLGSTAETILAVGLEEAVRAAAYEARAGDTVLLAPACASFDEFTGFAERGNAFRRYVEAL